MQSSLINETELPGRKIDQDTLQIIAHRYYWASGFVSGKHVLEVGCGPGLGLGYLSCRAENIIGGDLVWESLTLAKRQYGAGRLVCLDAHRLPFRDGYFDVVISLAAIIYMDVPAFVEECRRILKMGGSLIINTPNKDKPGFRPSRLSRRYYSVPELCALLSERQFDAKPFGAFAVPQGSARSWSRLVSLGKAAAGRALRFLGLYQFVKRLIGSETTNITLGGELGEREMELVKDIQVVPLPCDSPDRRHRIVYVVAQ